MGKQSDNDMFRKIFFMIPFSIRTSRYSRNCQEYPASAFALCPNDASL